MSTTIETRAAEVIAVMEERLTALGEKAIRAKDFVALDADVLASKELTTSVLCGGNQHTCRPQFFVPALDRRFAMELNGTGDSKIAGHHWGPRALLWQNTALSGEDPELGHITVHLEPSEAQTGTLVPISPNSAFPALNRNTYFFVFNIETVGELISERPAVVEALIDDVPPTGTYVFRNGPLNFYLRSDPTKTTVAVLEAAITDVHPTR